jgi:hypothetical protein
VNQRREGEIAGLRAALESVESDLSYERQEHVDTKKRAAADSRHLKEVQRDNDRLKTDIQLLEVNSSTPASNR